MDKLKIKRLIKSARTELTMLLVFVVFFVIMSFSAPSFGTTGNILNVLTQASVVAVLAIGQTFVILSGGIDLSIGSIIAISGMLGGMYMSTTGNAFIGILIILAVSLFIGVFNGFLVGYLKLPAFITTLGSMTIANSLTYVFSDGNSFSRFPDAIRNIGTARVIGIRYYVIAILILYVIMSIVLARTKVGRYTYAIGSNKEAARLSGVDVQLFTMICYAISGLMAGIATIVNTARLMAVDPTTGTGLEMDAIAAVVIGGTSMAGGRGTLGGTMIGVLIYSFLRNALNVLGINPFWQGTATGAVIIVAVLAESLLRKYVKSS